MVAALSRPRRGSGAYSTDQLKALNAAFEVWGLGVIHAITPYQQHIWDTQKIVVCPHGYDVSLSELSMEFGKFEKVEEIREVLEGLRETLFYANMKDREGIESFFHCDHPIPPYRTPVNQAGRPIWTRPPPLTTSIRHLGSAGPLPLSFREVKNKQGAVIGESERTFYFPVPEGFWDQAEIEFG